MNPREMEILTVFLNCNGEKYKKGILFYFTKFIKIKRLIQLTTDPTKRRLLYYQVLIYL